MIEVGFGHFLQVRLQRSMPTCWPWCWIWDPKYLFPALALLGMFSFSRRSDSTAAFHQPTTGSTPTRCLAWSPSHPKYFWSQHACTLLNRLVSTKTWKVGMVSFSTRTTVLFRGSLVAGGASKRAIAPASGKKRSLGLLAPVIYEMHW